MLAFMFGKARVELKYAQLQNESKDREIQQMNQQIAQLNQQLEQLNNQVAELSKPKRFWVGVEHYWLTSSFEAIPYGEIGDKHLFNILCQLNNWKENNRRQYVIAEAISRWGEIPVSLEMALTVCCDRADTWRKKNKLPVEGSLRLLLDRLDDDSSYHILKVVEVALKNANRI